MKGEYGWGRCAGTRQSRGRGAQWRMDTGLGAEPMRQNCGGFQLTIDLVKRKHSRVDELEVGGRGRGRGTS